MAQEKITRTEEGAGEPPLYQFEDMRLKPGDRLQIQLPLSAADERQIVRLIGYLDKQSVLITAPSRRESQKPMVEGDQIDVRVFLGQGAYGFISFVDKIIRVPFDYAHLSFPKEVRGLLVRNAPRVKTDLPATANLNAGSVSVTAVNLSATGMMLRSDSALGREGEELSVTLPMELYQVKSELKLRTTIKSHRVHEAAGGQEHRTGVEFLGLQPNETLILQSVVHHELVKNPYSVV